MINITEFKKSQKILKEINFEPKKLNKGYADRIMELNVGKMDINLKSTDKELKEKFVGGRGYGIKLLYDAVNKDTKWDSEENEIIIAQGPIAGITQYGGSGKSYITTISPLTEIPIDSNVGGHFGPLFKFCGFDALEIQGKSNEDIVIFIDGDKGIVSFQKFDTEIQDSHILAEILTEFYSNSEDDRKNISIVSSGSAANHTNFGLLNFSYYDIHRKHTKLKQAGRGGIGTVFRDKKLKALVVKKSGLDGNINNVHNLDKIIKAGIKLHREIHDYDKYQNNMRLIGTSNLIEGMNDCGLLPVYNFKLSTHPEAYKMNKKYWTKRMTQGIPDGCWYGCTMQCAKSVDGLLLKTGPYKGSSVSVDGPEYETAAGVGPNCGIFDPDAVLETNFYCDTYGIDTISFGTTCAFLMECFEENIINIEITGGLELHFGNWHAQLDLLHQMAKGEGFGKIAGLGIRKLKKLFVEKYNANEKFINDIGMECKGLEYSEYITKEALTQQAGYGTANKGAQHDEACFAYLDAVLNKVPTIKEKVEVLYYMPLLRTWFSMVGLCKLLWNDITPPGNSETENPLLYEEHMRNYIDVYNGVTGKNVQSIDELIFESERVYNLQKVFNIKMGKGLRKDDAIPYRSVGPVTMIEYRSEINMYDNQLTELGFDINGKSIKEKMTLLRSHREKQYETLLDVLYERKGWNNNGVPTLKTLKILGIDYPNVLEIVKPYL